ncbi:hypothetical protein ACN6K9_002541 [Streptomyces sp. SAS_267]|uniref:hypothetical protein n=1 Tax=Streptomyces sp. SAS_267 TaxID=3412750 RepID=UPI00403CC9F7
MGPLRGFRVVNLRVRDKVAVPDLTVDLAQHAHAVIGLENGGGKSTLLAFLLHVLLPRADYFLPRIAQRRQKKQGKEKRIEHYVPGGSPTHIILEVETPPSGPGQPPQRFLLGACLTKPATSTQDDPVSGEYFWSLPASALSLSLANLPLRNAHRLLDHNEWQTVITQLRTSHPGSGIEITAKKEDWDRYLRHTLKIDVEFVKSWLLAMNQDEGAADHVFTYATSRDFLNSLIKAIASPDLINQLKAALTQLGEDADRLALDRRRLELFQGLVQHTEALALHQHHLTELQTSRDLWIDHLLAALSQLDRQGADQDARLERHQQTHTEAETAQHHALAAYSDTHARQTAGRLQLAELQLQRTEQQLEACQAEFTKAETGAAAADAAALLVRLATERRHVQDISATLAARSQGAEPHRRHAASAVLALTRRLDEEDGRLTEQYAAYTTAEEAARHAITAAHDALLEASNHSTSADTRLQACRTEIGRIDGALRDAVRNGVLDASESPDAVLQAAVAQHSVLRAENDDRQRENDHLISLTAELTRAQGRHVEDAARADAALRAQESLLQQMQDETDDLTRHLHASALIDFDPIRLPDQDQAIAELLALAVEEAKGRELDAAVQAAAARRAVAALETTTLLPPPPTVAEICRRAAKHKYGARSTYAYLANLPAPVAEAIVRHHPALADGIVVNVPEDLQAVVELASQARADLDAPLVIATPQALEAGTTQPEDVIVILPDEAHWSFEAARVQIDDRHIEADRREQHRQDLGARYDQAENLRRSVLQWSERIGAQSLHAAEREVDVLRARCEEAHGVRDQTQEELADAAPQLQAVQRRLNALHQEIDAITDRAGRLRPLAQQAARRSEVESEALQAEEDKQLADSEKTQARTDLQSAEADQTQAQSARERISTQLSDLRSTVAAAQRLGDELVTDADHIDPSDARLDLGTLNEVAATRHRHWSAAVSDPQLTAEQNLHHDEAQKLQKKFDNKPQPVQHAARLLHDRNPGHSADEHEQNAARARQELLTLNATIGTLTSNATHERTAVTTVKDELRRLRRTSQPDADDHAATVEEAERVLGRLTAARETALAARTRAEQILEAAQMELEHARAARDLTAQAVNVLQAELPLLASSGGLIPSVDLEDRAYHVQGRPPAPPAPEPVQRVMVLATTTPSEQDPSTALEHTRTTLRSDIAALHRRLTRHEGLATRQLEDLEAALRDVHSDVVSGDKLVHMLRGLRRTSLLQDADAHHHSTTERRALLQNIVDSFDERVEDLSRTAFAAVQELLRGVQATVRDSYLPTTPALGRWAGLPLLKLSGLDTKKDQRRAAILSLLQKWFDPHAHPARPNFDADATIHQLVEAATPTFSARVLIPCDPLDPLHKPVDRLAVETSGGEGVTFALILAALLAARRAAVHGHHHTTLLLDNPFAKVTKPAFLRLARDIATSLGVRFIPFTGIRDLGALTVFPGFIQLRVSRRENANIVVPYDITDTDLQPLLRDGTLYVSTTERDTDSTRDPAVDAWPALSAVTVHTTPALFDEEALP